MSEHQRLIREAEQAFRTADHLAYVTLPLLQESKLLVSITENIHTALDKGMQALLLYEEEKRSIQYIPEDVNAQIMVFEQEIMPKYKISKDIAKTLKEVKQTMHYQQNSPVSFQRRERYVLCDKDYNMKKLDISTLKAYLTETRAFISFLRRLPC